MLGISLSISNFGIILGGGIGYSYGYILSKYNNLINENRDDETSYLLVTHYSRILRYLDVDRVHIVVKGNVVKSGSKELIEEVDSGGYTQYQEQ